MLAETIQLIQSDTWTMECLEAVDSLGLPDWNLLTVVRWILDRLDAGAGGPV
jgi:hypothetical protein